MFLTLTYSGVCTLSYGLVHHLYATSTNADGKGNVWMMAKRKRGNIVYNKPTAGDS